MRFDLKKISKISTLGAGIFIFAAVLFIGVAGSLYFFVVQPELARYLPGGSRDLQAKKEIIASRQTYLDDLRKLQASYQSYGSGTDNSIDKMLPSGKDIPDIFTNYEQFAKKMGVGVQLIDIVSQDASVKGLSGVKEIDVSLRFNNVDYQKFKELLKALESSGRLTDIISFDIQPDSRSASMLVKNYYMPAAH